MVTIPPTAPLDVQAARQKMIASAARIQQVVLEPAEYLPNLAIHVRFDLLWSGTDVRCFVSNFQVKEYAMYFCKGCCTVLGSYSCPMPCLIAACCKWHRHTQFLTSVVVSSAFMPSLAISLSNIPLDSSPRLRFLHRTRENNRRARIPTDERCAYGYDQQLPISACSPERCPQLGLSPLRHQPRIYALDQLHDPILDADRGGFCRGNREVGRY